MKKFIIHSDKEMVALGEKIAKNLIGGEIILLNGDLGSGKTTFTKGLALGLKVKEMITSPTFVLLKNYEGKIGEKKISFIHVDAYRTDSLEDIYSVGIEDFFNRGDVVLVIEWAQKIKKVLPKENLNLAFKFINEKEREVVIDFKN